MIGEKEMLDIAYVLSRNTPLRTLNLRDNVVDAKASLVLAQSLGSNSHLRELDLRDNKLGNAGVAVLMEPFILQKLRSSAAAEGRRANEKSGSNDKAEKDEPDLDAIEEVKTQKPKTKKSSERKLKMKMERILLNNNQQTDEALKHIYTALHVNEDIEITIDLPASAVRESEESAESSLDEDAVEELQPLSPTANPVVPHANHGDTTPKKTPGSARGEQGEDFDALTRKQGAPAAQVDQGDDEEGEAQESDKAPGDEDG